MRARDYAGPADIPRLQRLVASIVRSARGRPTSLHVGDVPWRLLSVPEQLERVAIRLWEEDGDLVGLAWLTRPDELELAVAPGRHDDVLEPLLDWAGSVAESRLKVDCLDRDVELRSRLESRGFGALDDDEDFFLHERSVAGLAAPAVAPGYTLRHVELPDDLERRVEVHRSAFGRPGRPSRLTVESYASVTKAWPYRAELDWVVEAPDGTFAAFCLAWLDDRNRVGLLEPVGTHERHRRAGHASAACLGALQALSAAGAERAFVSAASTAARALYRSVGFVEAGRFRWFAR